MLSNVHAQAWQSCDQWATYNTGGFTIYNNIWGSGAGSQCVWANSSSNWGVTASHPSSSGIKSYPNVSRSVSINVDSLGTCTSSFNISRPSGGSYNTAYDIWYNNYAYEIMLWMNWTGSVGPISYNYDSNGAVPAASNVNVGGHTWNVYRGNNGSNEVISFLRTGNTNSGTVNITAISQWIRNQGWFGNVNMHQIQFGWEITSSSSNAAFTSNSYSLSCSAGGSSSSSSSSSSSTSSSGSISNGRYRIISRYSGRAMDVEGRSTANGANIIQWSYGGGTNQQFDVTNLGNGYYSIRPAHSGKSLDVYNFCTTPGCEIRQWDYWGGNNQQWSIQSVGSGYYKIISRHNGLALDVWEWSTANGGDIRQWNDAGGTNQQWSFQAP